MIENIRNRARQRFEEFGYPTAKLEDWRFTNVSPIARGHFQVSSNGLGRGEAFRSAFLANGARLVFVNGRYSSALSSVAGLPAGVVCTNLASAPRDLVEKHLAKYASFDEPWQSFVALNTADFADGAFVQIPAGVVLAEPVQILFIAAGDGVAAHTRVLVVAERGSQASIIEHYLGDSATLTNTVSEIVAADNAIVEHYKIQQESDRAFHVGTLQVQQGRCSNVVDHSVALGGRIARNDLNFVLDGEGAEALLNGLYVTNGEQHVANHSRIEHAQPHCPSRELYKGILGGKSSAVFNGGIVVRQIAQKTDAKQSNKNLLLSEDAVINTKPQLEIWADDVKCTHGATIGHLDDEMLFYLRSRGIGEESARQLLTFAFANELLTRMKSPEVRQRLEKAVLAKLEGS